MDVLCSFLADIESTGRLYFLDIFCFCNLLFPNFLLLICTQSPQKHWVLLDTFVRAEGCLDCKRNLKVLLLLGRNSKVLLFHVTCSNSHKW